MNKGQVDVCLCAYNAGRFIGQAIKSILDQSYGNFILYIVNDASTDNTRRIAMVFLNDKRVRVVDLKKNIGTYACKNLVLNNFAEGEYWANHDADDYSSPDRLAMEIKYIEENGLDGCGSAIDEFYSDGVQPTIPADSQLQFNKVDGFYHRVNIYPKLVDKETISVETNDLPKLKIAMNGSLLFRLSAVKNLGGFDGHTKIGADSEFLWRFVRFYKFGNMPEVLYHRRFHKESLTQSRIVGHNSKIRSVYAQIALEEHKQCVKLLSDGQCTEALKRSTYNFYYPTVKFKIYE